MLNLKILLILLAASIFLINASEKPYEFKQSKPEPTVSTGRGTKFSVFMANLLRFKPYTTITKPYAGDAPVNKLRWESDPSGTDSEDTDSPGNTNKIPISFSTAMLVPVFGPFKWEMDRYYKNQAPEDASKPFQTTGLSIKKIPFFKNPVYFNFPFSDDEEVDEPFPVYGPPLAEAQKILEARLKRIKARRILFSNVHFPPVFGPSKSEIGRLFKHQIPNLSHKNPIDTYGIFMGAPSTYNRPVYYNFPILSEKVESDFLNEPQKESSSLEAVKSDVSKESNTQDVSKYAPEEVIHFIEQENSAKQLYAYEVSSDPDRSSTETEDESNNHRKKRSLGDDSTTSDSEPEKIKIISSVVNMEAVEYRNGKEVARHLEPTTWWRIILPKRYFQEGPRTPPPQPRPAEINSSLISEWLKNHDYTDLPIAGLTPAEEMEYYQKHHKLPIKSAPPSPDFDYDDYSDEDLTDQTDCTDQNVQPTKAPPAEEDQSGDISSSSQKNEISTEAPSTVKRRKRSLFRSPIFSSVFDKANSERSLADKFLDGVAYPIINGHDGFPSVLDPWCDGKSYGFPHQEAPFVNHHHVPNLQENYGLPDPTVALPFEVYGPPKVNMPLREYDVSDYLLTKLPNLHVIPSKPPSGLGLPNLQENYGLPDPTVALPFEVYGPPKVNMPLREYDVPDYLLTKLPNLHGIPSKPSNVLGLPTVIIAKFKPQDIPKHHQDNQKPSKNSMSKVFQAYHAPNGDGLRPQESYGIPTNPSDNLHSLSKKVQQQEVYGAPNRQPTKVSFDKPKKDISKPLEEYGAPNAIGIAATKPIRDNADPSNKSEEHVTSEKPQRQPHESNGVPTIKPITSFNYSFYIPKIIISKPQEEYGVPSTTTIKPLETQSFMSKNPIKSTPNIEISKPFDGYSTEMQPLIKPQENYGVPVKPPIKVFNYSFDIPKKEIATPTEEYGAPHVPRMELPLEIVGVSTEENPAEPDNSTTIIEISKPIEGYGTPKSPSIKPQEQYGVPAKRPVKFFNYSFDIPKIETEYGVPDVPRNPSVHEAYGLPTEKGTTEPAIMKIPNTGSGQPFKGQGIYRVPPKKVNIDSFQYSFDIPRKELVKPMEDYGAPSNIYDLPNIEIVKPFEAYHVPDRLKHDSPQIFEAYKPHFVEVSPAQVIPISSPVETVILTPVVSVGSGQTLPVNHASVNENKPIRGDLPKPQDHGKAQKTFTSNPANVPTAFKETAPKVETSLLHSFQSGEKLSNQNKNLPKNTTSIFRHPGGLNSSPHLCGNSSKHAESYSFDIPKNESYEKPLTFKAPSQDIKILNNQILEIQKIPFKNGVSLFQFDFPVKTTRPSNQQSSNTLIKESVNQPLPKFARTDFSRKLNPDTTNQSQTASNDFKSPISTSTHDLPKQTKPNNYRNGLPRVLADNIEYNSKFTAKLPSPSSVSNDPAVSSHFPDSEVEIQKRPFKNEVSLFQFDFPVKTTRPLNQQSSNTLIKESVNQPLPKFARTDFSRKLNPDTTNQSQTASNDYKSPISTSTHDLPKQTKPNNYRNGLPRVLADNIEYNSKFTAKLPSPSSVSNDPAVSSHFPDSEVEIQKRPFKNEVSLFQFDFPVKTTRPPNQQYSNTLIKESVDQPLPKLARADFSRKLNPNTTNQSQTASDDYKSPISPSTHDLLKQTKPNNYRNGLPRVLADNIEYNSKFTAKLPSPSSVSNDPAVSSHFPDSEVEIQKRPIKNKVSLFQFDFPVKTIRPSNQQSSNTLIKESVNQPLPKLARADFSRKLNPNTTNQCQTASNDYKSSISPSTHDLPKQRKPNNYRNGLPRVLADNIEYNSKFTVKLPSPTSATNVSVGSSHIPDSEAVASFFSIRTLSGNEYSPSTSHAIKNEPDHFHLSSSEQPLSWVISSFLKSKNLSIASNATPQTHTPKTIFHPSKKPSIGSLLNQPNFFRNSSLKPYSSIAKTYVQQNITRQHNIKNTSRLILRNRTSISHSSRLQEADRAEDPNVLNVSNVTDVLHDNGFDDVRNRKVLLKVVKRPIYSKKNIVSSFLTKEKEQKDQNAETIVYQRNRS